MNTYVLFQGIIKYDITTGKIIERYSYPKGTFGSETPFASKGGGKAEDDGYLIGFTTNSDDWSSYCEIFDAKSFKNGPIAKLKLPNRLSSGFHTHWVAGKDLFKD